MPSKFPGMDPFLEGQVWEDFHHRLITAIADELAPALRPKYVARIQERVYVEREEGGPARQILPDVSVLTESPSGSLPARGAAAIAEAPFRVPVLMPERITEPFIEIRRRDSAELVTSIEVLSPTNKRANSVGRSEYLSKRRDVLWSDAHLLEIDLLRGGEPLPMAQPLPRADYYVLLHRVEERPMAAVWPLTMRQSLIVAPVPLSLDEEDAALDLQRLFNGIYDRAGYDYSLDYQHGTNPPLNQEESSWVASLQAPIDNTNQSTSQE